MRILRLLLSISLAVYMTGAGRFAFAQDASTSPFSITLEPVQYAAVKGNVSNFEAINWVPAGANGGATDITFTKDINKNISVDAQGSFLANDDGTGQLTVKDGDLAFLKLDYNAFRKYYDASGGVYPYEVTGKTIPGSDQGAQPNSPTLQMDVSFFKIEAGIGEIDDPFLDVTYQHDSKNGDKSLEQWESAYVGTGTSSTGQKKIAPSWESVNDTTDTITLKENKEFAGITIKGNQTAEIDYNNDITYMQYLNDNTSPDPNQLNTLNESPDAKLFGSGVRFEKWMLNDNTYAALGYHYNHTDATDVMQQQEQTISTSGVITTFANSGTTLWNVSRATENDDVLVGNFNTNLAPNLTFVTDGRYEHTDTNGDSTYYAGNTTVVNGNPSAVDYSQLQNRDDQEGEHAALRYSGIPHTALYAETDFQQDRNWDDESYINELSPALTTSGTNFILDRIDRTQDESWTVGGRVVPNRFFTFSTQVKQNGENNEYDTVNNEGSSGLILMNYLREKGIENDSTIEWKPYHWLENSLKYQFSDNVYNPQLAPQQASTSYPLPSDGQFNITENHMLTSQFTYDISVQPTDSLLLMFTYSHVENYVRTVGASSDGAAIESGPLYMPDFNSGDNSFLFSVSYSPIESVVWTNTASYTISPNYVDFSSGLPLGSDFREANFTTEVQWTYHKWLKIGPAYEYASYKDDPVSGAGNYSANIFKFDIGFKW